MSVRRRLADPKVRLALGVAGLFASTVPLHRDRVGPLEQRIFRAVNGLPDSLFAPAWTVMQLGTVGAAPAAAALARAKGHPRLAVRLVLGGVGTWAASKVVKPVTGRPRPLALLPDTHVRGPDASGLGYPSGHAGVAVALAIAAAPHLPRRSRRIVAFVAPLVGTTRMYVGAHLPLDVMSGVALGVSVDAAVDLMMGATA